jgi:hypothetical protein
MPNVRPGDMAEIIGGGINHGRRVSVVGETTFAQSVPGFVWYVLRRGEQSWVVLPLQPLRMRIGLTEEIVSHFDRCVLPDRALRRILPPPAAETESTAEPRELVEG